MPLRFKELIQPFGCNVSIKDCVGLYVRWLYEGRLQVSMELLKCQRQWLHFRDDGRAETAKACEPYVAVLVHGNFRLPCVAGYRWYGCTV